MLYVELIKNAGCLKKSFAMAIQIQGVERWIVCTPLSVNVFVTIATQQISKYHCKALFETP
jgi:hypothetical protein